LPGAYNNCLERARGFRIDAAAALSHHGVLVLHYPRELGETDLADLARILAERRARPPFCSPGSSIPAEPLVVVCVDEGSCHASAIPPPLASVLQFFDLAGRVGTSGCWSGVTETTAVVAARVVAVRSLASHCRPDGDVGVSRAELSWDANALMVEVADRCCAGSAAIGSIVRVSRTIARLDCSLCVSRQHVAEAAWLSPHRPALHATG
jgi:hypothetical protein